MPIINQNDAGAYCCPWNNFEPCIGQDCMAWTNFGNTREHTETDNLVKTVEGLRPDQEMSPPKPDGSGWQKYGPEVLKGYHRSAQDKLPKARSQRWIREVIVVKGFCGRATPDQTGGFF